MLCIGGIPYIGLHIYCAWRALTVRRLKRLTPITGVVTAIHTVESSEGGTNRVMSVEFTPEVGPDAGKRITRTEPIRVFARFETVVGQKLQVYVDPRSSKRAYIPEAAQLWFVMSLMLMTLDLALVASSIYAA